MKSTAALVVIVLASPGRSEDAPGLPTSPKKRLLAALEDPQTQQLDLSCPESLRGKDSVSKGCLDEFPPEISQLKGLRALNLAHNRITKVPASIGQLSQLERFDLTANPLEGLPDELWNLVELKELVISLTGLTGLPDALGKLQKLELLEAFATGLRKLPPAIGTLKALKDLNLSANDFSARDLPLLGSLNQLERLDLSLLDIRSMNEDWLKKLDKLTVLNFEGTGYLSCDALRRKLDRAKVECGSYGYQPAVLDLRNAEETRRIIVFGFKVFPPILKRFHNITSIKFFGIEQGTLPNETYSFGKLEYIRTEKTRLTSLSHRLLELKNLKAVLVPKNQLREFPVFLLDHPTLETIDLEANRITHLPPIDARFEKFSRIMINGNPITREQYEMYRDGFDGYVGVNRFQPPTILFKEAVKLPPEVVYYLAFGDDNISRIPKAVFRFKNLEVIYMSFTRISRLPKELARLQHLRTIYLGGSLVTESQIRKLKKLMPNLAIDTQSNVY